jgi:hypothetical protein
VASARTAQRQGGADALCELGDLAGLDHVDNLAAPSGPGQHHHAGEHEQAAEDEQAPGSGVEPAGPQFGGALHPYAGLPVGVHHDQAVRAVAHLGDVPVQRTVAGLEPEALPGGRGGGLAEAGDPLGGHREGSGAEVDGVDRIVGDAGQVAGDLAGGGDADEGGSVLGGGGQAQPGVAGTGERHLGTQQRVHIVDGDRVAGRAEVLQRPAERATGVAVLHDRPESGPRQERRQSDGQQQHSEDRAEQPHLRFPLLVHTAQTIQTETPPNWANCH